MARNHAIIQFDIWRNPDFRDLPQSAQWTYLMLLSQRDVTQYGMLPLMPTRWAKGCDHVSPAQIRTDLEALEAARFVFTDHDSEELLIRSFIRNDGVLKQPNVLMSAARGSVLVDSPKLRAALAFEFQRVLPEVTNARAAAAVQEALEELGPPATVELRPRPEPASNPSPNRSATPAEPSVEGTLVEPFGDPLGEGEGEGDTSKGSTSSGSLCVGPSKPDPAPEESVKPAKREPRGSRIPDGFMPSQRTILMLREQLPHVTDSALELAHASFCDYWISVAGAKARKVDWEATWRTWMRREFGQGGGGGSRRGGGSGPRPSGGPTSLERKLAEAEMLKTNRDPRILAQGGLVAEARAAQERLDALARTAGAPALSSPAGRDSDGQDGATLDLLEIA